MNWQDSIYYIVLAGKTESGCILTDDDCKSILDIPVVDYTESEHKAPCWLRSSGGRNPKNELDRFIDESEYIQKYQSENRMALNDEIERMKLRTAARKAALEHALADIRTEVKALERDAENNRNRVVQMNAKKKLTALQRELMEKEERLFLDNMKLDAELENKIDELTGAGKLKCSITPQFVLTITGTRN
jgi:hypothetical protein